MGNHLKVYLFTLLVSLLLGSCGRVETLETAATKVTTISPGMIPKSTISPTAILHRPTTTTTQTPTSPTIPTLTLTPIKIDSADESGIPPYETLVKLFEYNHDTPLDLDIRTTRYFGKIVIQEVKYNGAETVYHTPARVPAYLIFPAGNGPYPAIIFLHAGQKSKDQFLGEKIL